jgi:hypothetical protein
MNRNLEAIAASAARECVRQGVDEDALIRLLQAHRYAQRHAAETLGEADVRELGWLVDPANDGYRRTPVTFASGGSAAAADLVPRAMEGLIAHVGSVRVPATTPFEVGADEWVKAFLDIHPFADGNGRVAWVLFNWLWGMLDNPLPLPEFYPVPA